MNVNVIRLLGQILVSVIALAIGIYVIIRMPDQWGWGAGLIGIVVGYWLR